MSADLEPPRARNTDPRTSHLAEQFIQKHVDSLRVRVLNALLCKDYIGLTTRQIAEVSGVDWGSVSPRMIGLEKAGWVVRGQVERSTPKHPRKSVVWYITQSGVQYLRG